MNNHTFLNQLEKELTSDDYHVREFALNILHKSFAGRESTFIAGLEASRKTYSERGTHAHLAYLTHMPVPENGMALLLDQLEKYETDEEELQYFTELCNHAGPCVIKRFQNDIIRVFAGKGIKLSNLKFFTDLCTDQKDVVSQKLQAVIKKLETGDNFDERTYALGKQIIAVVAERELSGETELLHRINKMRKKRSLKVRDLYDIALAGEMRLEAACPHLTVLAARAGQNWILLDEIIEALIKTGSDAAVKTAEEMLAEEGLRNEAVRVLSSVKTERARQLLADIFKHTDDMHLKTAAAAGLCDHLWRGAVSEAAGFVASGEAVKSYRLERALYCNAVINGISHPDLSEWRKRMEEGAEGLEGTSLKTEEAPSDEKQASSDPEHKMEESTVVKPDNEDVVRAEEGHEQSRADEPPDEESEGDKDEGPAPADEDSDDAGSVAGASEDEGSLNDEVPEPDGDENVVSGSPGVKEKDRLKPETDHRQGKASGETESDGGVEESGSSAEKELAYTDSIETSSHQTEQSRETAYADERSNIRPEENAAAAPGQEDERTDLSTQEGKTTEDTLIVAEASGSVRYKKDKSTGDSARNGADRNLTDEKQTYSKVDETGLERSIEQEPGHRSYASNEEMAAAIERIHKARAEHEKRRKQIKVGRNDPCPCGSGRKYKKCCMK